jgi:CHASE2 domain-containing sensor protein
MNTKNSHRVSYHTMTVLALIVGILGIAFQFIPDGGLLAFMLSVAVLGGLMGGSRDYEERDRQQFRQSYKTAFEWLLLAIMALYAFLLLAGLLPFMAGAVIFLNAHWPSLIISIMCLLMGMAGFYRIHSEGST